MKLRIKSRKIEIIEKKNIEENENNFICKIIIY